ncbi:ABC transporter ATP-binding protein [Agaricicola taiwanensis]|uniref:ABC transporter ATP-binding protein n=1 Tax=Agaricicola taiwanensis TaxID=591372 RepID=A0A8J2VMP8_9RHOB|nr:ABC transporter ATP-binding protein [Agaricicola taiwanensis]GGE31065.1 ABC transporter ATP-binding protein [Agaricicola taiwanensis]
MADLRLAGVSRRYGAFRALDDLNLDVADGEFLSLLGPSGCGKSTTLGLIAGLDHPTGGRIEIGGRVVADAAAGRFVPAERRNLGLVLQSYALWPHMTVAQNIALPLVIRKIPKEEQRRKAEEYLDLVEMSAYGNRYPHELSGGQQQRVALARTLVYEPVVLLLDEPLSNVDAKLRERARTWIKELQRRLKVTTIFVTHDQSEALTMSDRVAVISGGRLMQVGTPLEVYRSPATAFVADFVGSANFVNGHLNGNGEVSGSGGIRFAVDTHVPGNTDVVVAVRPEDIRPLGSGESADNEAEVEIVERDFLGARCVYHARLGDNRIRFESGILSLEGRQRIGFARKSAIVFAEEK